MCSQVKLLIRHKYSTHCASIMLNTFRHYIIATGPCMMSKSDAFSDGNKAVYNRCMPFYNT